MQFLFRRFLLENEFSVQQWPPKICPLTAGTSYWALFYPPMARTWHFICSVTKSCTLGHLAQIRANSSWAVSHPVGCLVGHPLWVFSRLSRIRFPLLNTFILDLPDTFLWMFQKEYRGTRVLQHCGNLTRMFRLTHLANESFSDDCVGQKYPALQNTEMVKKEKSRSAPLDNPPGLSGTVSPKRHRAWNKVQWTPLQTEHFHNTACVQCKIKSEKAIIHCDFLLLCLWWLWAHVWLLCYVIFCIFPCIFPCMYNNMQEVHTHVAGSNQNKNKSNWSSLQTRQVSAEFHPNQGMLDPCTVVSFVDLHESAAHARRLKTAPDCPVDDSRGIDWPFFFDVLWNERRERRDETRQENTGDNFFPLFNQFEATHFEAARWQCGSNNWMMYVLDLDELLGRTQATKQKTNAELTRSSAGATVVPVHQPLSLLSALEQNGSAKNISPATVFFA